MSVLFSKLLFVNSKCTSFWFPDWISAHFPSPSPSGFLLVLPIESGRGKLTVGARRVVTSSLPGLFTHRHTSMGTVYLALSFSSCSTEFFLHSWNHGYHGWTGVPSFLGLFSPLTNVVPQCALGFYSHLDFQSCFLLRLFLSHTWITIPSVKFSLC